jgi:hypothetical protein
MALTYEPIFTTTLSSSASIDITSIPGGYTDLILSAVLMTTTSNNPIVLRMNNISTSTYTYSNLSAVGGSITYDNSSTQDTANCGSLGTGAWSGFYMDIHDYTNTDYNRVFNWIGWRSGATSGNQGLNQGVWMNPSSSVLTRLTFATYTFIAGSTITLWGVKEL